MSDESGPSAAAAHYVLPAGYAAMLVIGAVAAGLHGALSATGVMVAIAAVVAGLSAIAEPPSAPLLGIAGWLAAVGFSRAPYGQLRPTGPLAVRAAVTMAACSLVAVGIGMLARRMMRLDAMRVVHSSGVLRPDRGPGLGGRRRVAGVLLAVAVLPLVTVALAAARPHLSLDDDLLIYLVVVVAVAVVGGFWPAVAAAVAASLLLNWYFTPPLHTFTIERPQNLLALLLFVTVAIIVSSVVHLAAHRAVQAARSAHEAASLLALAQTVLGGADTPGAVLGHLVSTLGGRAELLEHAGRRWVRVAASGDEAASAVLARVRPRDDLELVAAGQRQPTGPRLLDGFAAQAAAALDRERLRTQAAQAEALAEGNRMRTALLAAVSHDLRTPLASIKASVSTLRQADVEWAADDEAALLATIEESADRLDALIGNLLDMSRLSTASLQPFLRAVAVDEVAPLALRGLDAAVHVRLRVPDGLPLVVTDPGLLERVLGNLLSNALAHSPPGRPPALSARQAGGTVVLEVVDHGPGVPDEHKERIFEPFERLGGRGSPGGVGLGLAVARGFTDAMGASLGAVDTPGGGLTMRVTLPVAGRSVGSPQLAGR